MDKLQHDQHEQDAVPMGDITNFDIVEVQKLVEESIQDSPYVMIITAGPPCPDFSRLRASPPGIGGDTGWLFQQMLNVEHTIRTHFTGIPIENVLPHPTLTDELLKLTSVLAMEPIIVDAADAGLTHRKRFWWTIIN
eukprot:s739_g12.t1